MIGFNLSSRRFSVAIAKRGIIRPMRFVTRLCMLVVFFLAIGLTCSEMPELLSFTDDPSNDFVVSICAHESRLDRAVHERSNCASSNPVVKALFQEGWRGCVVFEPAAATGAELLSFLSNRRN